MTPTTDLTLQRLDKQFASYIDTMFEADPISGTLIGATGVLVPHNKPISPSSAMPWKHDLYTKDIIWGKVHGTFPFGITSVDPSFNGIAGLRQLEEEGYVPSETSWWTYNPHYYPIMVELVNMDRSQAIVRPVTDNWLRPKDQKHLVARLHTLRQMQAANIQPSLTSAYRTPSYRVHGNPRWCTFAEGYAITTYHPQRRSPKARSTYTKERIGELHG